MSQKEEEDRKDGDGTTTTATNNNNNINNSSSHFDSILPHEADDALLESFRYISSMPGKDVRGKLIDCFQLWLRIDSPRVLDEIKGVVGDLHNSSLLIDDIEDNSKLRRGIPVAHSIFGVPTVINTANYVFFLALEKCHKWNNSNAMKVFVGELLNLHRGQGHDIAWRDNVHCPSEQEYLEMVQDKTGGLFRLAVGLMQAFATTNHDVNYTPLVNNLAMYFQIRDDFINLADEEYFKSKSFCEDLTEGKFSFPILHHVQNTACNNNNNNNSDTRLISILKQRTEDIDVKRYAQNLMKESGSLQYTRNKCYELKQEIIQQIELLGGNPPLLKLIQVLDVQLENLSCTTTATTNENENDTDDDENDNNNETKPNATTPLSSPQRKKRQQHNPHIDEA